jgi:polysaccharide chain length determinant protein (PEP-CTERM system associated)
MVTSSTLKTLKEEDGPISPREQPPPARTNGLISRLQTWWQCIWRRRWLSVATAWVICMVGWAIIALWPTSFGASAVVYANLAELGSGDAGAEGAEQTPVAMLKAMLLSDDNLDHVRSVVDVGAERSKSLRDDIMIRSTVPPVFVLAFEHKDPDIAQKVLETLIEGFQAHLEDASSVTLAAAETLDRQIEDHLQHLKSADAEIVDFERTNADHLGGASGRTAELALLREEIESLQKQVTTTTENRDAIAEDLAKAREPEPEPPNAEQTRSPEQLASERSTLEAQLSKLQERYADTHPYVVAVVDAIETLNTEADALAAVDAAVEADEAPIDRDELEQRHGELIVEVSALNSRLTGKRRELELLEALTQTTTSVEAELAGLRADKEEIDVTLQDLKRQREELGNADGGNAEQEAFRPIRQPELPTDPVGPSRLMALAGVLLGGLGLGAIAAVLCNGYKGVFESAWQLRQRFDVGVLGTISEVMTPAERRRLGHARVAFGLACLALIGMFGGLVIAELTNALAPMGEQLRTRILG